MICLVFLKSNPIDNNLTLPKMRLQKIHINYFAIFLLIALTVGCSTNELEGSYKYEVSFEEGNPSFGVLKIGYESGIYSGTIKSFEFGGFELEDLVITENELTGTFQMWGTKMYLKGTFKGDHFKGSILTDDGRIPIIATRLRDKYSEIDRSDINYILSENDLQEGELNIDHSGIIEELDEKAFERGGRVYNSNCINCHGNEDTEGSIPLSLKFWSQPFKAGSDPFSMYQTTTRGYGSMPPQLTMTPQEKYDVITYIRENFVRRDNEEEYYKVTSGYLASLPEGTSKGPESVPYHPWSDMDYGNFFINTYELVDEETGIPRYHSPGPSPFPDENYLKNNFAYKGIAIRLDEGKGGVQKEKPG